MSLLPQCYSHREIPIKDFTASGDHFFCYHGKTKPDEGKNQQNGYGHHPKAKEVNGRVFQWNWDD